MPCQKSRTEFMRTVGILCSDSSDVYQAQAIYYLGGELRKNSYASMLCCWGMSFWRNRAI